MLCNEKDISMNKKMILKLIDSDDQQNSAAILKTWFEHDPSLMLLTFAKGRGIVHLLTLKNKPLVLKELLQIDAFKLLVNKADKHQKTPLHYAVMNEKYKKVFNILLDALPQLDSQDKAGNTALHKAVLKKQIWAIIALVKTGKANRLLANKENKTVIDLTQDNPILFKAIMYLDLAQVPSFGAKNTGDRHSIGQLKDTFPLLSTSNRNRVSPASSKDPMSWHSLFTLDDFQGELEVGRFETISEQINLMVLSYEENSDQYSTLRQQFILTCKQINFSLHKVTLGLIFKKLSANHDILDDVLHNLSTELQDNFSIIQTEQQQLMEDFLCLLINESLHLNDMPLTEPSFVDLHVDKPDLLRFLWTLTAGFNTTESKREIDLERIINAAFYLQNKNSFTEILIGLEKLFPFFDRQQKLVANYIVWQLLTCNVNDSFFLDSNLVEQLYLFDRANKKNEEDLAHIGTKLSSSLSTLINRCDTVSHQPLYTNYQALRQITLESTSSKLNQSFNALVDRALSLNGDDRKKEVAYIAQELSSLSIEFYQKIVLSEFADMSWTKEDPNLAANILRQTTRFNQMSNYFLEKILQQPSSEKTINAIQLLIQIGQELCPLSAEQYIDLHSIMIITSVLENSAITRLKPYLAELKEIDQAIVAELIKIVDLGQNKYWQRVIQSSCRALPYSGLFQSDLTFAKDGNQSQLGRAEACGNILLKILAIKQLVNFKVISPRTDLIEFIDNYIPIPEEHLYEASLRKLPKESKAILDFDKPESALFKPINKFSWSDLEGCRMPPCEHKPKILGEQLISAWLLINKFNYDYLDQYTVPQLKFKNKIYPSLHVGDQLINFFIMQLKELDKPAKSEHELSVKQVKQLFLLALADKTTATIHLFILIHNNYQNEKLSKSSTFSLQNKIKEMRELLAKKIEMNIELKSKNNSKLSPEKRKSFSFFSTSKIAFLDPKINPEEPDYKLNEGKKRISWPIRKNSDQLAVQTHSLFDVDSKELTEVSNYDDTNKKQKSIILSTELSSPFSLITEQSSVHNEGAISLAEANELSAHISFELR